MGISEKQERMGVMEELRQRIKGQKTRNKFHLVTPSFKGILYTKPLNLGRNGYFETHENISA